MHRAQHIVVIMANIYYCERIQSKIIKMKGCMGWSPAQASKNPSLVELHKTHVIPPTMRFNDTCQLSSTREVNEGLGVQSFCSGGHTGTHSLEDIKIPDSEKEGFSIKSYCLFKNLNSKSSLSVSCWLGTPESQVDGCWPRSSPVSNLRRLLRGEHCKESSLRAAAFNFLGAGSKRI